MLYWAMQAHQWHMKNSYGAVLATGLMLLGKEVPLECFPTTLWHFLLLFHEAGMLKGIALLC